MKLRGLIIQCGGGFFLAGLLYNFGMLKLLLFFCMSKTIRKLPNAFGWGEVGGGGGRGEGAGLKNSQVEIERLQFQNVFIYIYVYIYVYLSLSLSSV